MEIVWKIRGGEGENSDYSSTPRSGGNQISRREAPKRSAERERIEAPKTSSLERRRRVYRAPKAPSGVGNAGATTGSGERRELPTL